MDGRGRLPAGELPFNGLPVFQRPKQLPSQEDQEDGESSGSSKILLIRGTTNHLIEPLAGGVDP